MVRGVPRSTIPIVCHPGKYSYRCEELSLELENPSSGVRKWRYLEDANQRDPDKETLIAKIQWLEECLNSKKVPIILLSYPVLCLLLSYPALVMCCLKISVNMLLTKARVQKIIGATPGKGVDCRRGDATF
jgi:hypothetical protein